MNDQPLGIIHFKDGHTEDILGYRVLNNRSQYLTIQHKYMIVDGKYYKGIVTKDDELEYVAIDNISKIEIMNPI
jgi:hypothetical protein